MPDASGLTFTKAFAKTAGVLRQAGIGSPASRRATQAPNLAAVSGARASLIPAI